ncbi:unnamed protein product [Alopecurus aequalis]
MDSSSSGADKARRNSGGGSWGGGGGSDPFDIPGKGAPVERLKKWRQAALVLNASRRFRYTLDLKKEEQKEEVKRKIRAQAHVIRAAYRFKEAARVGVQPKETEAPHVDGALGFGIKEEQLTVLTRDHNYSALQQYGGISGVANMLKTDTEKGISEDDSDLKARQNAFGSNTYPRKKGKSFVAFVWDACKDLTLIILMVAAAVSLALGIYTEGIKEGWYDGASIAFAVLLVIFVTAFSDYKQSLQFQNLNEEKQNIHVEVVRGGRRIKVSIYDLVVGDILPLKIGDQVPADGILISGHSFSIDESSMTGESKIVNKDQKSPFMMSGCKVADGYGTMLVTAVGINTEWGLLMASISEDSGEETPLQVRLNGIATFIGIIGLSIAVVVLIVLVARYFTGHTYNPDGSPQYVKGKMGVGETIRGIVKIFTIAVTIVVVAVPEGLPLAVTLTLAFSMRKMMKDKALVRRLSACETMGSATTICSDKTGTLTLNQMNVVEAYFGGKKMVPTDNTEMLSVTFSTMIIEGIAQNTSGSIFEPEGGKAPEVTGSPTEKAILSWGLQLGMKFNETRSKSSILQVFPFNSEKKRGGVAVQVGDSEVHVYWKGAAELILESCTDWLDADGSKHSMTPEKADEFKKFIEDMAVASLRCVAFAYRPCEMSDVPNEDQRAEWVLPEDNLIMLGIVGIKDPCRPGVADSIRLCTAAGIKVMGRSSPNDKLLFVKALRSRGHVVAVTGDGTNDAPALHEADIGLSMGIAGTEVAKESSDIIILDDNFASIVRVVRWGRSVYANIQKFIQFQLTVNVAALIINVVSAITSGDVPLNAVQLLWVNLIMDTLGALALATEPPNNHLMQRPPVGRREPLVTNIMWRNLLIMAFFQVAVLLTLTFEGVSLLQLKHDDHAHAEKVKNTFIFNTFVLCQVFNEFNARKPDELNIFKGITGNRLFMAIIAVTVVLQVLIIEFLGKFTSTVRLTWQLWLVSIGLSLISWPLAALGKLIPVADRPFADLFMCCCKGKKQADEDVKEEGSAKQSEV